MKTHSKKHIAMLILLLSSLTVQPALSMTSIENDVLRSTFVGNGVIMQGVNGGIVDNGIIINGTEVGNG